MAATLTAEMLKDIEMGNASVRLVEQTDTITDTTFDDADQIFTTEGTLQISQAEATKTEFKIDQRDAAVAVNYESGEFNVNGTVPSSAIPLFDYFYNKSGSQPTLTTGITSVDGATKYTEANGYDLDAKRKKVTMLVESQSKKTAIIFTNVELVTALNWGDVKTTPIGLTFTGTVMASAKDKAPSFIILKSA